MYIVIKTKIIDTYHGYGDKVLKHLMRVGSSGREI